MANENVNAARGPKGPKGASEAASKDGTRKLIDGRSVFFSASGDDAVYEDTGEVFFQEEHDAIQTLTLGRVNADHAWSQIRRLRKANPAILFWIPEYKGTPETAGDLPPMIKNPLVGVVLTIFEKPIELRRGDKRNDDGSLNVKWCAFVMLTLPCMVRNRDKAIVPAKAGDVIWLDLNQSIVTDVRKKFAPRRELIDDPNRPGAKVERTVQLFEIAIDPRGKVPFTSDSGETLNAWRMNLYQVPRPTPIGPTEIAKIKCLITIPSIPGDDDLDDGAAYNRLGAAKEAPALPPAGGTSSTTEPAAAEAAVTPAS